MKRQLLLGNFVSMATLRLGLAALTFSLFWLLSHRLTTSQLGGFSLLMNLFFMVQALPLLGMTMPLIRRIAAHPAETVLETSNSFFFALPVAGLIGGGLAVCGYWYSDEGLVWPFVLLGLSMLPSAWIVVAECALVGQERMRGIAAVNLMEALGRFLGSWLAIRWGFGLTGIFLVFAGLRLAAALTYLADKHLSMPRWHLVRPQIMRGYRQQVPTYLAIAVITALCARLDIIVVSRLLSLREAGIYAAAARLSDAALMVPTMAAVVLFPSQSRLFEADQEAFARLFVAAVRICLIGGFVVALVVVAMSSWIVQLIYAPNLAQSAPVLQVLILGSAIMVVDQMLSTTMMAARAQRADLASMSLGLLVLLPLLFALTHFFGLLGTAMAAPVSLLARVSYRLFWAQNRLAIRVLFPALRIVLTAAAGIGVFFLRVSKNEAADFVFALGTYATLLWLTRAITVGDWRSLRHLVLQKPWLSA